MGSLIEVTSDGTFPSPLKFYSDAILYDVGVGDGGSVTGDGVFVVAQFSNYPYDPFTTLSVTNDWLEVGAERNTGNDTWTVSFRTKNDDLYDITSGVVKLADFVGGTDYPLTSSVVNGLTDIKWGFYDTNPAGSYPAYVGNLAIDTAGESILTDAGHGENKGLTALDLKGDYCVVAEGTNSDGYAKQVHIYKNVSGTWSSKKVLHFTDSGLSSSESTTKGWAEKTLFNSTQDMLFVTASYFDHSGVTNSGCVIVFKTSDDWTTLDTPLIISRPSSSLTNGRFGSDMCLSSDDKVLVVGCIGDTGRSYAFYTRNNWTSATYATELRAYKEQNPESGGFYPAGTYNSYTTSMAVSSNGSGGYIFVVGYRDWSDNRTYTVFLGQDNYENLKVIENGCAEFWRSTNGESWIRCATPIIEGNEDDGREESFSARDYKMHYGYSVAISGQYIFIGAPRGGDQYLGGSIIRSEGVWEQGHVYVLFTSDYNNISWNKTLLWDADPADYYSRFGVSLSVYGNNLIVGSNGVGNNANYGEKYYLYSRHRGSTNNWGVVQNVRASDFYLGDQFGHLCVINESYIAITSPYNDTNGTNDGTLHIYDYSGAITTSTLSYYNAYYYKPSGSDNYTTDNTGTSSSGVTTVTPSVSTTYSGEGVSTTLHNSLYNPDTATSADGERVTTVTDISIDSVEYGSVLSLYTTDTTNSLYLGNNIRYNGWLGTGSNVNVIPYTEGGVTVNCVKSITITSSSFDSGTTYFTNVASGWYYYQTVDALGVVTLHFDAINDVARDITIDTYDSVRLGDLNVTGSALDTLIDQLNIISTTGTNPATFTIYYTNVTATSSADTYFTRYKASQTGYDGIYQFRIKESYKSQNALNPQDHLVNLRGAIVDTGKATFTQRDPDNIPSKIDVTEFFGRHVQLYIRFEGGLYIINGKRYSDGSTGIFPYSAYDSAYPSIPDNWTGLKKYSMTSSLFDSGTTYFTDVQSGWTYTQTDNGDGTVTLSFEYTSDSNGYDLTSFDDLTPSIYVAKSAINVDILSGIMRTPVTASSSITYSYEYFGSIGTVDQQGYDGIFGTSVNDTFINPLTTPDIFAIDDGKNTIDEQGGLITTAEGDPHVRPINGSPYDLPHEEETFLLYSNNDTEYPVTIKGKCWYLPEYKYMKKINRLNAIGYHERADRYLELFKENTYFKYLEFVCGPEHVIIDMDRLRHCDFTSMEDLENHVLPLTEGYYENNKYINLTGFRHSKTGIVVSKKPMKTTLDRVITMRGKDSIVTLRMIWDVRDIINRNGIEIKFRGLKHSDTGSLVRECVIYSQFGLNYETYGNCTQLPLKRTSKVYSASSYGATEDKKSSLSEKTSFNQSNKIIQNVF